ncbi:MAG: hybrid sensor histidine kinase/response regulator [Bacteroidota bacterium]
MNSGVYRILAVDDNPRNLMIIPAILSSDHFKVDSANSGQEALNLISEKNYDVVLMDIMMPGMDGFETCSRIKQEEKNLNLPVIFLTAKTEVESITQAFKCGGLDYLSKPFRSDELIARVTTHAELKRHREQQKEINRWLEQKVEERTLALRESHAKLSKALHDLQSLDHAKNEFLRMINHEIRTPLNAILGFTDLLKNEPSSAQIYEMVRYIDTASVRLEKFLMVVLQITALLANNQPVSDELVFIDDLFKTGLARLQDKILAKKIKLNLQGFDQNISMHGNKTLLLSCFESILDNSVKFSPVEGTLIIRVYAVENLFIEIIDEGPGFSERSLNQLFKLFAVGEKHVDQTTGLGLALVKLIMDAHQAKIEIMKNQPTGARVRLIF